MSTRRERLNEQADAAAWHVRFDWLRARENIGAEASLQRDGKTWRVNKGAGAKQRCVGRGSTIAEALDAAMRNVTA